MTAGCPSILDLCAADPGVRDHVASCPRCRALVEHVPEPSGAVADDPAGASDRQSARDPAAQGSVWTVAAPGRDVYRFAAVLESNDVEARIAAIGEDDEIDPINTDFGVAHDRVGFLFWVRCAATFSVLVEQLREPIGQLDLDEIRYVKAGIEATATGADDFDDPRFGPPVLSERDPRRSAFERWSDDVAAWREPWELLGTAQDLGAVCAARRVQLGISVEELAEQIDFSALSWSRFESAELDLAAVLPTATLAAAIRELALPVARKVLALAAETVTNTFRADPGYGAPALARRRQGVRRVTPPPDPAAVERAANQYAAGLGRALDL